MTRSPQAWEPRLDHRTGPRYLAIADAIGEDMAAGRLTPGDRLPTHRDLAYRLNVTVGTVSRAYGEAERRGLAQGEVGRGTFVRAPDRGAETFRLADKDTQGNAVDLRFSLPPVHEAAVPLSRTLMEIAGDLDVQGMLQYHDGAGLPRHRAAVAGWCARAGDNATPDNVTIAGGTHHAVSLVLTALAKPGSTVLTEALTFPMFKVLAQHMDIRLHGLPMDEHGVRPDALDQACRTLSPSLAYLIPTFQNPTMVVMPEERRRDIVAVARRHGLMIIEDDIAGRLQDSAPPTIASLAPECTFFIDSASKTMAPGLRVGYVIAPLGRSEMLRQVLRASTWMAPPLMGEILTRWIKDGTAERLTALQRAEATARKAILYDAIGGGFSRSSTGCHVWLPLPEPWRAEDYTMRAERQGVRILAADTFLVGHGPAPEAVRIGIGAARDRDTLRRVSAILGGLLGEGAREATPSVI